MTTWGATLTRKAWPDSILVKTREDTLAAWQQQLWTCPHIKVILCVFSRGCKLEFERSDFAGAGPIQSLILETLRKRWASREVIPCTWLAANSGSFLVLSSMAGDAIFSAGPRRSKSV
eukprot:5902535-Amphidinium_carterae.1